MDPGSAFAIPYVTAVYRDDAGAAWRIGFTVPQADPAPADFSDALTYLADDWPSVTAEQVGSEMQSRWESWIQVVTAQSGGPPAPPDVLPDPPPAT